jgi:hypothetical protein
VRSTTCVVVVVVVVVVICVVVGVCFALFCLCSALRNDSEPSAERVRLGFVGVFHCLFMAFCGLCCSPICLNIACVEYILRGYLLEHETDL